MGEILTLPELIQLIDEPNKKGCELLIYFNDKLFYEASYLNEVEVLMNAGRSLYLGLDKNEQCSSCSLSDVLLVLFLHNLAKPWMYFTDRNGQKKIRQEFLNNRAQIDFRHAKFVKYNIVLNEHQRNAIHYVCDEIANVHHNNGKANSLASICLKAKRCAAQNLTNRITS